MLKEQDMRKLELLKGEMVKPVERNQLTEEKIQKMFDNQAELFAGMFGEVENRTEEMFNEHYRKIEELFNEQLDRVCFRIYSSVKAELRRQLRNRGLNNG